METPSATNPDTAAEVEIKTYYSRISGQRFVFADGFEVHFLGKSGHGILELSTKLGWLDKDGKFRPYYAELDAIIGRQPHIYISDVNETEPVPVVEMPRMVSEQEAIAGAAQMSALNARTQESALGPDPAIQNAMSNALAAADEKLIDPVEQAKAAAAARLQARQAS